MSPTYLRTPFTGEIRIDPFAGHAPTWRPDHGEEPIYLQLVAELGPPGLLAGPAVTLPGLLAEAVTETVEDRADAVLAAGDEALAAYAAAVAPC